MKRVIRTVPLGGGEATRHFTTLFDEPSSGADIKRRQFQFLQELVNDGIFTGVLNCGPMPFERLEMHHDGQAWRIDLEAVERKS